MKKEMFMKGAGGKVAPSAVGTKDVIFRADFIFCHSFRSAKGWLSELIINYETVRRNILNVKRALCSHGDV